MKTMQNKKRSFLKDKKGVAAIEFALIMPALLFLIFGGYATYDLILVDRTVNRSSAVIADLTSRSESIDDAYANSLIEIGRSLVGNPAEEDEHFDMSITSISNTFDTDNEYELEVNWSFANKNELKLEDDDIDVDELPFIPEGESVILVDMGVRYGALFFQDVFGIMELGQTAVRRPRFVTLVPYDD